MTLLQFKDEGGREWEVWEVGARPQLADRPVAPNADPAQATPRWLCFASGTERRRLLTYPPRWQTLSPADLAVLCRRATPARPIPYTEPSHRPRTGDR